MGILKNLLVLGSAKFANVIKGTVEHAQNGIYFGTCTTAGATAAKVITLDDSSGFELKSGAMICVKFTNTNTANNVTFNVNNTGAKSVSYAKNTAYAGTTSMIVGNANYSIYYVYDGTYWCFLNNQNNYANNVDTQTSAYCATAAGTAAKTASMTYFALRANEYVHINFIYNNTAASALTLNINGTGAKPIYINGSASSSSNYTLPAGSYIAFYDGTNYQLRTDNKLPANITGTVNGHTVSKDVPSNAVFTDTTALGSMTGTLGIDHGGTGATTAANARSNLGLGAAATYSVESAVANDSNLPTGAAVKSFVEGKGYVTSDTIPAAYCATAAATADKVASMTYFALRADEYVHINFRYANTAGSALTLNINGTGAKPIYINGEVSSVFNNTLPAGSYIAFYDGINYRFRTDNKIPANISGNAETVNNHTVGKNVPSNAVFTDTTDLSLMTGKLPIARGGTNATTAVEARSNLGFGDAGAAGNPVYFDDGLPVPGTFTWGVDDDQNVQVGWDGDAPEIVIPTSTPLPISSGGTGATTTTEARSKLGLGSAATYNVVSQVQDDANLVTNGAVYRYVNHTRTQLGLEGNLLSKTYTGIIGTANNVAGASFYAIKVVPNDYNGEWSIRYRITAETTGVSVADGLGHQVSDVFIQGMRNTYATYWIWNDIRNTTYKSYYYNILYRAKAAGVSNGYGHIIGVGLRDSWNRLNTANPRTITVEVLDYKDCTVSLFDSMVKYENAPGTGTTNYDNYTEFNGSTQGFTKSGSDSNTYDRTYVYGAAIRAESAIVAGNIIVAGTNSYYHHLKLGTAFDTTYPILYSSAAIAANANSNSNTYISIPFTITTTQSITLTAQSPVFIKGQLSGTIFTPVSTTPLTQSIPSTADGYEYILLGQAYSTTQVVLAYENPIFAYRNGKWREVSGDADTVNGHTVEKDVPSNAVFTDTTALTSMTGTLAIGHGGTGATSAQAARANLGLGCFEAGTYSSVTMSGCSGYVTSSGTRVEISFPFAVPSTVSTINITGVIAALRVASGGYLLTNNADLQSYLTNAVIGKRQRILTMLFTKNDGWGITNNSIICGTLALSFTLS